MSDDWKGKCGNLNFADAAQIETEPVLAGEGDPEVEGSGEFAKAMKRA